MIIHVDIYAILLIAKKVAIYAFLVCKIFGPKMWSCKIIDKFQVCMSSHWNSFNNISTYGLALYYSWILNLICAQIDNYCFCKSPAQKTNMQRTILSQRNMICLSNFVRLKSLCLDGIPKMPSQLMEGSGKSQVKEYCCEWENLHVWAKNHVKKTTVSVRYLVKNHFSKNCTTKNLLLREDSD